MNPMIRCATMLAMMAAAPLSIAAEPVQILLPGLWHGEEVTAEAGPDWWGIFPEGEGFTLQAAPVTMTIEEDPVVDAEGQSTGKRVRVPQEAEPVLLVRGIKNLKEGRLSPLFHTPAHLMLYPGQSCWLRVRGVETAPGLSLVALGTTTENGQTPAPWVDQYALKLYEGSHPVTRSQTLYAAERVYEEAWPMVVWAGDLDRDDKVDLLLNLTDHYNVTHYALFLTSAAREGELAGKVAEWRTTGC